MELARVHNPTCERPPSVLCSPAHLRHPGLDPGSRCLRPGAGERRAGSRIKSGMTNAKVQRRLKPGVQNHCNAATRSEKHTSELQSLMRISYAVICLKNNKRQNTKT